MLRADFELCLRCEPLAAGTIAPKSESAELCLFKKILVIARNLQRDMPHHHGKAQQGL